MSCDPGENGGAWLKAFATEGLQQLHSKTGLGVENGRKLLRQKDFNSCVQKPASVLKNRQSP